MASFPASTTSASAYALTTAFSAPTQCAESVGGLTMLERDQFRIWLNHPLPVPLTTISSCYPTQFMSSFLLQTSGVSQVAFSPLVCPVGYTTQGIYTSNYIACCPSGYGFAPASNPPSNRPAFGGTCYTNIFNVPIQITSYDSESIQASSLFTATGSLDQAYAFPYEGFALDKATLTGITSTGSQIPISTTTSPPTGSSKAKDSSALSTGALAGIIIGAIFAALLLTGAVVIMLKYRKKRMSSSKRRSSPDPSPLVHDKDLVGQYERAELQGEAERNVELEAEARRHVHEIDGVQSYTNQSRTLD